MTVVVALDCVRPPDLAVPALGLLDEAAHALTAWLCLTALVGPRNARSALPWVLIGAVLIDLDHVPLYLGLPVAVDSGRPVTHGLGIVGVLSACSLARHLRRPALGLAAGVLLHLLRDLATGPGVPLLWPWGRSIVIDYDVYVVVLVVAALTNCLRWVVPALLLRRRPPGPSS